MHPQRQKVWIMASLEGLALASNILQTRQSIAIATVRQSVEAERAIVQLIAQSTGTQPLNASGRGSNVNLLT